MTLFTYQGTYNGKPVRAEIDVRQADVRAGAVRTRLQAQARLEFSKEIEGAKDGGDKEISVDVQMLRQFVYPDYIAGSPTGWIEIDGERLPWPLSFETFVTLPFDLCARWEAEVYRENPYWLPEAAETQKKA